METQQIPRLVKLGVGIGIIWKIIVVILWASLQIYQSSYYRFGPSDTFVLAFVDVLIDTWWKYTLLLCYIVIECAFKVIGGDFVYFWINAVAMNPGVPMSHDRLTAYSIVNLYWGLNNFNQIFFFALTFSQVDVALISALSSTIAGMISSYCVIYDSKREEKSETFYDTL